jgi:uncharacterized SAM-binding protein YcdF (DUF218 family)
MGALFKRKWKLRASIIGLVLLGLTSPVWIIPFKLAIALYFAPVPQAILVLGGNNHRMYHAAEMASQNPTLKVWVSDYAFIYEFNSGIFRGAGVGDERMHYNFCATDTVTNFTCTVGDLVKNQIRHLYLVTSDFHIQRAKAIATFVLGSRAIAFTPVSVPAENMPSETQFRRFRDALRAIAWIYTGKTGSRFNGRVRR